MKFKGISEAIASCDLAENPCPSPATISQEGFTVGRHSANSVAVRVWVADQCREHLPLTPERAVRFQQSIHRS